MAKVTPCFENGKAGIARGLLNGIGFGSSEFYVLRSGEQVLPEWIYCCVTHPKFRAAGKAQMTGTGGLQRVPREFVHGFTIPLPPLDVQREFVAEIEGYQRVLDGARAVVDNWRPRFTVDPEWPITEVGAIAKPQYGYTATAADDGDARFVRITDISGDGMLRPDGVKFVELDDNSRNYLLADGDLLVARTGATYGKTTLFAEDYPAVFASYLIRLRFENGVINPRYYWAFAQSDGYWEQAQSLVTGGGQPQFNGNALKKLKVPVPPAETQLAIAAEVEAEQALVSANRELMERMERRIQDAIARVWEG